MPPPDAAAPPTPPPQSAHAPAETEKERDIDRIAHGDVADGHVFEQSAIDRLERDAATRIGNTIRDGNVAETAVGFCAELDAAVSGRFFGGDGLVSVVEQRAFFVASGNVTIRDGHVIRRARVPEAEGTFQADAIVPGRVDAAIGDADIAAAVDVDRVAVGVDGEVVDSEVVAGGSENAEVAAVEN